VIHDIQDFSREQLVEQLFIKLDEITHIGGQLAQEEASSYPSRAFRKFA
jgi:hypothetical protein